MMGMEGMDGGWGDGGFAMDGMGCGCMGGQKRPGQSFSMQTPNKALRTLPAGDSSGNWICPACGNENFPHRSFCNRRVCGQAKPGLTQKEMQRNEMQQQIKQQQHYPLLQQSHQMTMLNTPPEQSDAPD